MQTIVLREVRRVMRTIHAREGQVHFGWDRTLPPVLEVRAGDVVEFDVLDAGAGQITSRSTSSDLRTLDFGRVNPTTGPVFVRGADPGDVLEVEILELSQPEWGWTAIIPGFGLLADEYPEPRLWLWDLTDRGWGEFKPGVRVPLRPFPGTIGVALDEPGHHSVVPPRKNGGNMDIRHLTAGTTVLLPVWVEGALFSVGDTHAAQGDGEVCGTAIESPMRITLRFGVRKGHHLLEPQYMTRGPLLAPEVEARGFHATTGIAPDLLEAARRAVRHMIQHLERAHGLDREEAYALASIAVDLKVSEVVDAPNWLVSAYLPLSLFA